VLVLRLVDFAGFSIAVWCFAARRSTLEMAVPFPCAATRLRDVTAMPCGLACQCPWTALTLLTRERAIVGEAHLAMNIDKLTESDKIN